MWSTKQLAELAGTTLRAVRHYHEVGLLEEPARRSNGYKEYGVPHLLRVLRIKRLTDLGFSLTQVAAIPDEGRHSTEALRELDARLGERIEALERSRAEVRLLIAGSAGVTMPPDLAGASGVARVSDADRSFIVVMSRVLGPQGVQGWKDFLGNPPAHPAATAFDELTDDADDATRQGLAEQLVSYVELLRVTHPALEDDVADAPRGARFAQEVAVAAVADLYTVAQRDVLARLRELREEA